MRKVWHPLHVHGDARSLRTPVQQRRDDYSELHGWRRPMGRRGSMARSAVLPAPVARLGRASSGGNGVAGTSGAPGGATASGGALSQRGREWRDGGNVEPRGRDRGWRRGGCCWSSERRVRVRPWRCRGHVRHGGEHEWQRRLRYRGRQRRRRQRFCPGRGHHHQELRDQRLPPQHEGSTRELARRRTASCSTVCLQQPRRSPAPRLRARSFRWPFPAVRRRASSWR